MPPGITEKVLLVGSTAISPRIDLISEGTLTTKRDGSCAVVTLALVPNVVSGFTRLEVVLDLASTVLLGSSGCPSFTMSMLQGALSSAGWCRCFCCEIVPPATGSVTSLFSVTGWPVLAMDTTGSDALARPVKVL